MCQTLLYFPHRLLGLPLFGFGWVLAVWGLLSLLWVGGRAKATGWSKETQEPLPFLLITGIAIALVLPHLEAKAPNGEVLGLPVRGYGALMLLGVVSGWALSVWRARRWGIDFDTVASLGFWVLLVGIAGARTFFVIEYWPEFRKPTWTDTILQIFKFTEGGLVVYGSLLGGLLAYICFAKRYKLPMLMLGDVIAPGVVLGMAIGRLGCLMNGCCYGGLSEQGAWGIHFPRFSSIEQHVTSPPYQHQLENGQLHGFSFGENEQGQPVIKSVESRSAAERAGLTSGVRVAAINGVDTPSLGAAHLVMKNAHAEIAVELADRQRIAWSIGSLPENSLAVHPIQVYSAVSGFLICLLLLSSEPFLNRNGAVLALLFTAYPIVRFLEEIIRVDEPGQLGTQLTISQLVSLAVLASALVLWGFVVRRPPIQISAAHDA